MFEGRYSLAVSPEGIVTLPTAVRKELHRLWGAQPPLLCFGVQYLYICHEQRAESLLRLIDRRLCAAFPQDLKQVNAYFRAMERSVAPVDPMPDGRFVLPEPSREQLGVAQGGLLTLLGVDDHLELWDKARLEQRTAALDRRDRKTEAPLLETPICLQNSEYPCSLLRDGKPLPGRCGPCMYLRLP